MKQAQKAVLSKSISLREAARSYNISRPTLQSRIRVLRKKKTAEEIRHLYNTDSGNESSEEEALVTSKYTVNQVFTLPQEKELAAYIKKVSDLNYGLTYKQIRELAYEFATVLKCKMPSNWKTSKIAGNVNTYDFRVLKYIFGLCRN